MQTTPMICAAGMMHRCMGRLCLQLACWSLVCAAVVDHKAALLCCLHPCSGRMRCRDLISIRLCCITCAAPPALHHLYTFWPFVDTHGCFACRCVVVYDAYKAEKRGDTRESHGELCFSVYSTTQEADTLLATMAGQAKEWGSQQVR